MKAKPNKIGDDYSRAEPLAIAPLTRLKQLTPLSRLTLLTRLALIAGTALLTLATGCSWFNRGGASETGLNTATHTVVAGELKPAGEDEFLAGNYKAARPLLTAAGREGSLRAVFYLRIITERGLDGKAPNVSEANTLVTLMGTMRKRLEELAYYGPKADRPIYQAALALAYYKGLIEGGQDFPKALTLAREAASSGFAPAANLTAAILLTPGVSAGTIKNLWDGGLSEAFNLSLEAARKNDVLAMGNVGYLYRTGQGVSLDVYQGASWARKAADRPQTTPRVLNDLGAIYEEGRAVTYDKAEALRWYGLASARGYQMGSTNLSRLRSDRAGPPEVLNGLEY